MTTREMSSRHSRITELVSCRKESSSFSLQDALDCDGSERASD